MTRNIQPEAAGNHGVSGIKGRVHACAANRRRRARWAQSPVRTRTSVDCSRTRTPTASRDARKTQPTRSAPDKAFYPCLLPLPRRHPRCPVADPERRKPKPNGGCSPEGRPRKRHAYPSPSNRAATPAAAGHAGRVVPWAGPAR